MMTKSEISRTGTTTLQLRLAVVDYSTIPSYQIEAELIREELKRRAA